MNEQKRVEQWEKRNERELRLVTPPTNKSCVRELQYDKACLSTNGLFRHGRRCTLYKHQMIKLYAIKLLSMKQKMKLFSQKIK